MFLLVSKFKMIGILMNVVHGPGPMKPGRTPHMKGWGCSSEILN